MIYVVKQMECMKLFCKFCGKEIDNNCVFCPNCKCQVNPLPFNLNSNYHPSVDNSIAIVGFILSFIFPIVGIICCAIGYKKSVNYGAPYKAFAVAGIIINSIYTAIVILPFILLFHLFL